MPGGTHQLPGGRSALYCLACLNRNSSRVQLKGWTFNTDRNVTLNPNGSNEIVLASNVLSVEIDGSTVQSEDPVFLNGKIYDRWNQTYTISRSLKAFKIVYLRDWDQLPPVAQDYITRRSARLFQDEIYGASELRASASREEAEAYSELRRLRNREGRPNLLTNDSTWNIIGGGRGPRQ